MKKVLIAGATGPLGHHMVREFKKRGFLVRALARNTGGLEDLNECIDEFYLTVRRLYVNEISP